MFSFHIYTDSVFDLLAREREELAAQLQGDAHESEENSSPAFEDILKLWERVSNQVRTGVMDVLAETGAVKLCHFCNMLDILTQTIGGRCCDRAQRMQRSRTETGDSLGWLRAGTK